MTLHESMLRGDANRAASRSFEYQAARGAQEAEREVKTRKKITIKHYGVAHQCPNRGKYAGTHSLTIKTEKIEPGIYQGECFSCGTKWLERGPMDAADLIPYLEAIDAKLNKLLGTETVEEPTP